METEVKRCIECGVTKSLDEYGFVGKGHQYRRRSCKVCVHRKVKEWCQNNRERRRAYAKREDVKAKSRANGKRYYAEHREEVKRKNREYMQTPEGKAKSYARHMHRRRTERHYRLAAALRCTMNAALRGNRKSAKTTALMGCTIEELVEHLERQFQPGMTWANHGVHKRNGPKKWAIDHIIPISAFDLSKEEEQRRCFHWSNLQPLWALDNIRKGSWVPDYQI